MAEDLSKKLMSELELAQLRSLASPARQEIIGAVQTYAPCSIAEIAKHLGRPADSLYYHMRHLTKVGLIKEHSTRKASRREEVLYETPHTGGLVPCNPATREGRTAVIKSTAAMLRATTRNFTEAYNRGIAIPTGPNQNIAACRYKGWVSREDVRAILEHMDAVRKILSRKPNGDGKETNLYAASVALIPLEPNEKSASRNGSG